MLNSLNNSENNSETARSDGYVEYTRPMAYHQHKRDGLTINIERNYEISELNFTYIKETLRIIKQWFSIRYCKKHIKRI